MLAFREGSGFLHIPCLSHFHPQLCVAQVTPRRPSLRSVGKVELDPACRRVETGTVSDSPGRFPVAILFTKNFQVPKMEESSPYVSCMDTAYLRESPPPKQAYKVPETFGDFLGGHFCSLI